MVGLGGRQLRLDFLILDDATFFQIDQQHLAGLEPPFADDIVFLDRQHARFRCHDDMIIIGHEETRGAQAIAVQRGTDLAAIGEGDGGGAVPWFHQRCVIFVEGATLGIHHRVAGPGFGHQHHDGVGQRIAACEQQLERIVEARRVRLAVRDERPHLIEVRTQQV